MEDLSVQTRGILVLTVIVMLFSIVFSSEGRTMTSKDAYIHSTGAKWVIGTDAVERTIEFVDGKLLLTGFRNKITGKDLLPGGKIAGEFFVQINGTPVSGSDGGWKLTGSKETAL